MKKNFKPAIKQYLIGAIYSEDHGFTDPTAEQLFKFAKEKFYAEYGWQVPKLGVKESIKQWLLGLALSVDYTYYDIELLMKSWSVLDGTETERQLERELDRYWDRLSMVLFSEFNKAE